jgi:hypothetical protein
MGLPAWGEAESIFRERMGVLTFAKGREWKWRKRLKAKWLERGKLLKRSEHSPS